MTRTARQADELAYRDTGYIKPKPLQVVTGCPASHAGDGSSVSSQTRPDSFGTRRHRSQR
jgi:hypothetical protein